MNLPLAAALLLAAAPPAPAQSFDDEVSAGVSGSVQQARDLQKRAASDSLPAASGGVSAGDGCVAYAPDADVSGSVPDTGAAERIAGRGFPSAFMAWHGAFNLDLEPFSGPTPLPDAPRDGGVAAANAARHDLAFFGPSALGMKPVNSCAGLAIGYTPSTVARARDKRARMLADNPNLVLLAEIRWHDAPEGYLPKDSPWLKAGDPHQDVPGKWNLLNIDDPTFRRQVALQCKAAILTGVFDGCMFDWWSESSFPALPKLAQEVRAQIGDSALILVNANNRVTPGSAPYINGFFMEGFDSRFWPLDAQGWSTAEKNLVWQKQNLHPPVISCLEGWTMGSRGDLRDLQFMRALTALSLTRSDGFVLFGDPNTNGLNDHVHDWYPFWDKGLGRPNGDGKTQPDGSVRRDFSGGTAVYNPAANKTVTVRFPRPYFSRATHLTARDHTVPAGDGDIFTPAAGAAAAVP